jgi:hypothetical protein
MSENTLVTRPRLAAVNRRQLVMRTLDVESLIEEDHSARLFKGRHRSLACEQIVTRQSLSFVKTTLLRLPLRAYCDCRVLNNQSDLPSRSQKLFIRGN